MEIITSIKSYLDIFISFKAYIHNASVIPLGDLPNLISVISLIVLVHRGNVIHYPKRGTPAGEKTHF